MLSHNFVHLHSGFHNPLKGKHCKSLLFFALLQSPWAIQASSIYADKYSQKPTLQEHFTKTPQQQRYIIQFQQPASELASAHKNPTKKRGVTLTQAKHHISRAGGQIAQELPRVHAIAAYLSPATYQELQQDTQIVRIEQDPIRKIQAHPTKQSSALRTAANQTTPQSNALEIEPYGLTAIQANGSYADNSESQKVCVIDTGYDLQHNDLMQGSNVSGEVVASFDSQGTPVQLGEWFTDGYGQGTHISGTLSALGNNGFGIRGVASTGVMPIHHVKVIHKANYWAMWGSDMIAALEKCQQAGAKIVNVSLSGQASSHIEQQAFANAWEAGVMIFAAAGNRGDSTAFFPASYPEVISVGATTEGNSPWRFTQKNSDIELVAPGEAIYSTYPNNQYRAWDGTGVAVPYVAGVAALAWGQNPQCSASTIREALQQSALDLGDSGRDNTFGHGLVQLQNTLTTINNTNCEPAPAAPIFHHVVQVDTNAIVDIPFASPTIVSPPEHGELETASIGMRYVPSIDFEGFDYFTMLSAQGEEKTVQLQVGHPAESTFYLDSDLASLKAIYDQGTLLTLHSRGVKRLSLSGELLQESQDSGRQINNIAVLETGDILVTGYSGSTSTLLQTFDNETLQLKLSIDVEHGGSRIESTSYQIIPQPSGGFTLFWAEPNFIKGRQFNANLEPISDAVSVGGNSDGSDNFYYSLNQTVAATLSHDNGFEIAYAYKDEITKRYMVGIHQLSADLTTQTTAAKWQTSRLAARLSLATTSNGDAAVVFSDGPTVYLGVLNQTDGQLPLKNVTQSVGANFYYLFISAINDKWLLRWSSFDYGRFVNQHTEAVLFDNRGVNLHEPIVLGIERSARNPTYSVSSAHGRIFELAGYHSQAYSLNWFTPESWVSPSIIKQSSQHQIIVNQGVITTQQGNDLIQNVLHVNSGAGRDHIINGEQINAGSGHDRIELFTAQTRTIDGGDDFDVLVVHGEQQDFELLNNPDGSIQLNDKRASQNTGNNQLHNIEAIAFTDSQQLLAELQEPTITQLWHLPLNTAHSLENADTIVEHPSKGTLDWINNQWYYQSAGTVGTDAMTFIDKNGQVQQLEIHVGSAAAGQQIPLESGSKSRIKGGNNGEVFVAWNKIAERRRYFSRFNSNLTRMYKGGVYLPFSYQNKDIRSDVAVLKNGQYGVVYNYGDKHYNLNYSENNRTFPNSGVSSAPSAILFAGQLTALPNDILLNSQQLTWNHASRASKFQQYKTRIDDLSFRSFSSAFEMPPLQNTMASSAGLANGQQLVAASFNNGIYYHLYSEHGQALGEYKLASTHSVTATAELQPVATAALPNEGFVIAWTQTGGVDGEGYSIALRYFAEDGTPTTEPLIVNQTTEGDQQGVRMTTLSDGRVAVVWWSETGDGDGKASFIRWFNHQGEAQSNEQLIMADTFFDQFDPDITTLSDNRVMVSLTSRGTIIRVFPTLSSNGDDVFYSYQPELDESSLTVLVSDALYYGNEGIDSVFYPGNAADYTISTLPSGEQQVRKPNGSIDRLFSIENIRFY